MKQYFKSLIRKLGYKVTRLRDRPLYDLDDPYETLDILLSVEEKGEAILFDVGANTGQTVSTLRSYFPSGKVYAFEPGTAFAELKRKYEGVADVELENAGLGAFVQTVDFHINSLSDMSSVYALGTEGWGTIETVTKINLRTVDSYCQDKSIQYLTLLKSDTQGYDLEVLRGAEQMLPRIHFVLLEVNFSALYEGLPSFDKIFAYMNDRNFKLVKFFSPHYDDAGMTMADVLFVNSNF